MTDDRRVRDRSVDFSENATEYGRLVGDAVGFSGLSLDFFTRAKALLLSELVDGHFGRDACVAALDVGCGVGLLDAALATERFRVTGVDVAAGAIEQARSSNPGLPYAVYDGSRLPFDDGTFDLSFTVCVMHHLPVATRLAFVGELRRVTRPGGMVCVIEHNPVNPLTLLAVMRCPFDKDAVLLPAREVRLAMSASGLGPADTRYFLLQPSLAPAARAIEKRLSRLPLGAQYCVSAVV